MYLDTLFVKDMPSRTALTMCLPLFFNDMEGWLGHARSCAMSRKLV